jgi:hypothetical protein
MALQSIRLGPPLIYEDTYSFNKAVLIKRCEDLAANTPGFGKLIQSLEIGNAGTTAVGQYEGSTKRVAMQENQPHTWPELAEFSKWALNQAKVILKSWEFEVEGVGIGNSWVNKHGRGGWTNSHVHFGASLSLAAYIQADERSGHLLMVDPLEYHWSGYPNDRRSPNRTGGYRLPVEDNKVYFFAPFIRHGTEQSQSDQDRWVLSINFYSK